MRGRYFGFLSLIVSAVFAFTSCSLLDSPEQIPAYIRIDTVLIKTNSQQGKPVHNLVDVWVDVGGKRIGTFEYPVIFPVLAEGKQSVMIMPGIKENGISEIREIYPFLQYVRFDTVFTSEEVLHITPVFEYKDDAVFSSWMESFEDPGHSLEDYLDTETSIEIDYDPEDGSNRIGIIKLDSLKNHFVCATKENIDVPWNDYEIYLELDYENSVEFGVGLAINSPGQVVTQNVINVSPRTYRNRIYINLTSAIRYQTYATSFKVFIKADLQSGQEDGIIYLDNIKLVHF